MDIITKWCNVDQLFYIQLNDEDIRSQKSKPTNEDLKAAFESDQWQTVFDAMRKMRRVRVSDRIYYEMMGAVPPKKQTATSFYCGECYSGNLYYYFEIVDGKRYGQLKAIN